ncbi:phosphoheptose isomerase [Paenibacillus sp. 32O-W]|nr:phosphoheptose isomerase [Paenibacillus sp. 32O-W]
MKGFMSKRPVPAEMRDKLAMYGEAEADYLAGHLQGALPAISLVSQSALSTAFINDVAADMVFAQQVYGYGRPGDALLVFSTSGNSLNVVRAVQVAKAVGLTTIAMTGESGGRLKELCDIAIRVPYTSTPDIQERHLPIYHALCMMLEEAFFG